MRAIALAVPCIAFALPAMAQGQNCGPSHDVIRILAERHGEAVIWRGQVDPTRFLFLYANPETGSWTAVVAIATGRSCIVAHGVGFEVMEYVSPKKGEPS